MINSLFQSQMIYIYERIIFVGTDKNTLILKSLGELVYKLRKEKKMTQEELGKRTGTSQMTVKRLESATVGTRIDNLVSITDALGIKLTDLFSQIEGVEKTKVSKEGSWESIQNRVAGLTATEREWVAHTIEKVLNNPWKES